VDIDWVSGPLTESCDTGQINGAAEVKIMAVAKQKIAQRFFVVYVPSNNLNDL
jgi:hypothetical protein